MLIFQVKISKKVAFEFLAGKCYLGCTLENFYYPELSKITISVLNGDAFGSYFRNEKVG